MPPVIAAALAPSPRAEIDRRPILADDGDAPQPTPIEFERSAPPPDVYLLESAGTGDALAGALGALSARARAPAEFIELDEPIATPDVIDADTVLWWQTPIESWGTRVAVPVIVEQPIHD